MQRNLSGFQVDLGRWSLDGGEPLVRARNLKVARPGLGINVGNPHVIVALSSEAELASTDLSVAPELEPRPAEGANVEFVAPADPMVSGGIGHIRMRVHERGSGETLSCGTGAAAAALATRYWAGAGAPEPLEGRGAGGNPRGADVGGRRRRARVAERPCRPRLRGPAHPLTAPNGSSSGERYRRRTRSTR